MLLLHNEGGCVPSKMKTWALGQSKTHPLQCHSQDWMPVLFSLKSHNHPGTDVTCRLARSRARLRKKTESLKEGYS